MAMAIGDESTVTRCAPQRAPTSAAACFKRARSGLGWIAIGLAIAIPFCACGQILGANDFYVASGSAATGGVQADSGQDRFEGDADAKAGSAGNAGQGQGAGGADCKDVQGVYTVAVESPETSVDECSKIFGTAACDVDQAGCALWMTCPGSDGPWNFPAMTLGSDNVAKGSRTDGDERDGGERSVNCTLRFNLGEAISFELECVFAFVGGAATAFICTGTGTPK
jgi:hypothetical protein